MEMQRHTRMMRLLSVAGLAASLAVLSGCGSSGSSNPWTVVSTVHDGKADNSLVKGVVGQPSQVQVTVVTKPNIKATTHFTIACGPADYNEAKNKAGPTGTTPLTFRITVPRPLAGPASCDVVVGAFYPSKVDSTVTIFQRDVPVTTTT